MSERRSFLKVVDPFFLRMNVSFCFETSLKVVRGANVRKVYLVCIIILYIGIHTYFKKCYKSQVLNIKGVP